MSKDNTTNGFSFPQGRATHAVFPVSLHALQGPDLLPLYEEILFWQDQDC